MDSPSLVMGLAVQPDVLRKLAGKRVLRERGLLARFMVAVPKSNLGFRKVNSRPVPRAVRSEYEARVRALLGPSNESLRDAAAPQDLVLSAQAARLLVKFEEEVEEMLRPSGDLADIPAWGGKLVGLVARLAGLLHLADHTGAGVEDDESISREVPGDIHGETVKMAIGLGRYAVQHALAAFGLAGANPDIEGATRILAWLRRTGKTEVSRRDIHVGLHARFARAADLDGPIALLIEHRYVREIESGSARTGRPPSPRFEVHPEAFG